jgi:hypothetical protein
MVKLENTTKIDYYILKYNNIYQTCTMLSPLKIVQMPISQDFSWKLVFDEKGKQLVVRWSDRSDTSLFELSSEINCMRFGITCKALRDNRVAGGGFKYEAVVKNWFIWEDACCQLDTEFGRITLTGCNYRGASKTICMKSLKAALYKQIRNTGNPNWIFHNQRDVRAFAGKLFHV